MKPDPVNGDSGSGDSGAISGISENYADFDEWMPSESGAQMLDGEAGAPVWHCGRWQELREAPPSMLVDMTRRTAPAYHRDLRSRFELLRGLGPAPWDSESFSVVGPVATTGAVVGRDFALPAAPETSISLAADSLGVSVDEIQPARYGRLLRRLQAAEIEERRRFVELSEIIAAIVGGERFLDVDVVAYVVTGNDVRVAKRDQHERLVEMRQSDAEAEDDLQTAAQELLR